MTFGFRYGKDSFASVARLSEAGVLDRFGAQDTDHGVFGDYPKVLTTFATRET